MGQQDVKQVLKKSNKWLISNEIAKKAGYSMKSIQSSLRRLVKWGEVKKVEASKVIQDESRLKDRSFAGYAYKIKDLRTLDNFDFKNKTVLLRLDLNSEIKDKKTIENKKFIEHAKTVSELLSKQAKLVIITNQGFEPKDENFLDLQQHSELLSQKVGKKIKYIDSLLEKPAQVAIKYLKPGEAIMLKNLSHLKEERKENSLKKHLKSNLIKKLSPLFDIYVNDAFSLSHLSIASVIGFPSVLPSCAGRLFEHELDTIQLLENTEKEPVVFILGGKDQHAYKLLHHISKNKKSIKVLTCGLLGHLCLLADEKKLGSQEKILKENKLKLNKELKEAVISSNIILPKDLAVSTFNTREEVKIEQFPTYQKIYDLGEETIKEYCDIIKKARTIFLKGIPSYYQDEKFEKGTKKILNAIQESQATFKLISGTETISILDKYNIDKEKINHLSLSNSALINYLAAQPLPGIEALKIK